MITSLKNPKVAAAVKLKKRAYREREQRFLVEGAQAVGEAIRSGVALEVLFHSNGQPDVLARASRSGVEVVSVSEEVMGRLTSTVTPQGLVAVAPFIDTDLDSMDRAPACVTILHAVRDPGNAGTVLRSADGAGASTVVFCHSSVDVYNPKTVRASAGSLFHLPVIRGVETADAIDRSRERGCRILAAAADGEADLYELDLSEPTAFLFGNEAWGLPSDIGSMADVTVRVPIQGRAESLNLAAAATVCLFEWARQRREGRRVALETLIASAAHDIRSPLTAMKGFGYALSTRWEAMSDQQRTLMLEGIVYDTDRLNTILKQLVDAARITGARLELFPERLAVGEIVESIAGSLGRDPDHPQVVWEGGAVETMLDPDRLRTIIEAFIEAAVWWGREGPIIVSGRLEGGRLEVEVFRAGADLAAADAAALFQPRPPGTGAGSKIGLFVSRGIAEAQGGTATAEVDGGIRFRLSMPADAVEHPA